MRVCVCLYVYAIRIHVNEVVRTLQGYEGRYNMEGPHHLKNFYVVCVHVCIHCIMSMLMSEEYFGESMCPSTMWVPGIELKSPGLAAGVFSC